MPQTTRRDFLKATVIAGAALSFGETALRSKAPSEAPPAPPSWADRPMRWAHLQLVENDPGNFDWGFWLDYFKRIHCDAVCFNAGGCVAYYPTKIPFHHRSAWLGDRDLFGQMVSDCRKLGMVVVARTDPHATYGDAKAAHPDWIAVTADGEARPHWAAPGMWVTCWLGPYNFDFMTDVTREILCADHGQLLRNAVSWATNEPPPATVAGPGVLDVTVWRQRASLSVHLVNLTNPMMMKGPVREIIPIGEQRVRVRLPDGVQAAGVRLLVAGTAASYRQEGEWLETSVPSVSLHEVVAVDFA